MKSTVSAGPIFDQVPLPCAVVRRSALQANIELFADYCRDRGVSLAPHVKTTMSPEIARLQLKAGSWGLTVATVQQAEVAQSWGAPRILLANEVTDRGGLKWLGQYQKESNAILLCYVDSKIGVNLLDSTIAAKPSSAPLDVLVEIGHAKGRTGVRTIEEGLAVARASAHKSSLRLAGVAGFEGTLARTTPEETKSRVVRYLEMIRSLAEDIDAQGLFEADEIVISAGGSAHFDLVAEVLGGEWTLSRPVRCVLRSGCYVTHDSGVYDEISPLGRGSKDGGRGLISAVEVFGAVLSTPEPDLVVVGIGKRDASFDERLPVPTSHVPARSEERTPRSLRGCSTLRLNDQHAYLSSGDAHLDIGDLVGFGISHPCTTFDRWRLMHFVDDTYHVVGTISTHFH